jgi:hypothetical protein
MRPRSASLCEALSVTWKLHRMRGWLLARGGIAPGRLKWHRHGLSAPQESGGRF